jgi:hypothetical protein
MNKAIRTTLSLVLSLVLFSALAMAQAGAKADKNESDKEHHSRLAKAAFWRHHKNGDKNVKQTQPTQASKPAQAKTAQLTPASAKPSAGKKNQKPEQHASNMSKPSAKKAPAANKVKPQPKAQDHQTALLK